MVRHPLLVSFGIREIVLLEACRTASGQGCRRIRNCARQFLRPWGKRVHPSVLTE